MGRFHDFHEHVARWATSKVVGPSRAEKRAREPEFAAYEDAPAIRWPGRQAREPSRAERKAHERNLGIWQEFVIDDLSAVLSEFLRKARETIPPESLALEIDGQHTRVNVWKIKYIPGFHHEDDTYYYIDETGRLYYEQGLLACETSILNMFPYTPPVRPGRIEPQLDIDRDGEIAWHAHQLRLFLEYPENNGRRDQQGIAERREITRREYDKFIEEVFPQILAEFVQTSRAMRPPKIIKMRGGGGLYQSIRRVWKIRLGTYVDKGGILYRKDHKSDGFIRLTPEEFLEPIARQADYEKACYTWLLRRRLRDCLEQ